MLDPRRLLALVVVAKTGSLTAAAEELGMTQPGVGYLLRSLETQVGTQLFVRAGRGVHLTEAGVALERRARPILAALSTAEEELVSLAGESPSRMVIATFAGAIGTLLVPALKELATELDDLEVVVDQMGTDGAIQRISAGDGDLALVLDDGRTTISSDVLTKQIATADLHLVVPTSHKLATADRVRIRDLIGERLIIGSGGLPETLGSQLDNADLATFSRIDDPAAAASLVEQGIGLALVAAINDTGLTFGQDLAAVPFSPRLEFPVVAVWSSDLDQAPSVEALLDLLGVD